MDIQYRSAIQSIYRLMGEAYYLSLKSMGEKEQMKTVANYGGNVYQVQIQVLYQDDGSTSVITATTGNTQLVFEANEDGGMDIKLSGDPLEEELINEITRAVMYELENRAIEDDEDLSV